MNRDEIKERAVQAIAGTISLTAAETENLKNETAYKALAKWTSARHAEIIVALEDEFHIEIDERSIPGLINVTRIVDYVQKAMP